MVFMNICRDDTQTYKCAHSLTLTKPQEYVVCRWSKQWQWMAAKDNAKTNAPTRLIVPLSLYLSVYRCCTTAINDMFAFMFDNKNAFASHWIVSDRIKSNRIHFDKAKEKNWANNSFNHIKIDRIVLFTSPSNNGALLQSGGWVKDNGIKCYCCQTDFIARIITPTVILCIKFSSIASLKGNMDDWQWRRCYW